MPSKDSSFNIVLFGETGVGKSSVINLLAGDQVAEADGSPHGCTMESKKYTLQIDKGTFNIWDTVGLGEPTPSKTNSANAVEKARKLVQQIRDHGGLDLLLFCIRGDKAGITDTVKSNYRLFFKGLCQERVSIAMVVTHLEHEAKMEEWWDRNAKHVDQHGLKFSGHACVTGLPGHAKAEEGRVSLEHLLAGFDSKGRYNMPLGFWGRIFSVFG